MGNSGFKGKTGALHSQLYKQDTGEDSANLTELLIETLAEAVFEENRKGYRDLFENVPTGIYRTTPDGRILMANPALVQMLGYSSFEELTSRNLEKEGFATPYLRAQFRELLEREDEVRGLESQWVRRDGTVIFVRENARAIRGERGDILYYEGTVEDITERKRAEEMLNESEQRYRTLAEHTYDLVIETNLDGRFLYVSPRHKHVLGYMPGELMNRNIFENIHPDDRAAVIAEFQSASRTFNSGHAVFRFRHKNGQWCWLESTGKPYRTATNEIRAVIASRDITERKQSEEQIRMALREKEVLLREIHHRVKNNLQFISSLLILESKYIRNSRAIAVFDEIRNRIRSMAIVHEQLYRSKNLAMIDSVPYIQDLVSNLLYSYNVRSNIVQLKMNIDEVPFNIDTAIPVGLIINELVSNSLKHAFPRGRKGEIRINLHSDGGNKFTLIVGDSGVGFPKGFDFSNIESVGLQLVLDLVEQLEGTIRLNTNHGTEFEITFEELKYNERGYDNGKTDPNC